MLTPELLEELKAIFNQDNLDLFKAFTTQQQIQSSTELVNGGVTILHLAAKYAKASIAGSILSIYRDENKQDRAGNTPIMACILVRNAEMFRVLLQSSTTNLDQLTANKQNLLHSICLVGDINALESLLQRDNQLFERLLLGTDLQGNYPLHLAINASNVFLQRLIGFYPNVNLRTVSGRTPLSYAVTSRREQAVQLLLAHGADASLDDYEFKSPIVIAVELQANEILTSFSNIVRGMSASENLRQLLWQIEFSLAEKRFQDAEHDIKQAIEISIRSKADFYCFLFWQKASKLYFLQRANNYYLKQSIYAQMTAEYYYFRSKNLLFPYSKDVTKAPEILARRDFLLKSMLSNVFNIKFELVHQRVVSVNEKIFTWRNDIKSHRDRMAQLVQGSTSTEEILSDNQNFFCGLIKKIYEFAIQQIGSVGIAQKIAYAFLGLGSIGREEMSTHSDIDYAIVVFGDKLIVEDEKYFLGLCEYFELLVAMLAESKMTLSVGFMPLREGFCVDHAGISPLTNYYEGMSNGTALLGTINMLVSQHQNLCVDLGDHAENALRNAKFICGDEGLYKRYIKERDKALNQIVPKDKQVNQTSKSDKKQAKELTFAQYNSLQAIRFYTRDLASFNSLRHGVHVKEHLYRFPNTVITALSQFFKIYSGNMIHRVTRLLKVDVLNKKVAKRLRDISVEVLRLRIKTDVLHGGDPLLYISDIAGSVEPSGFELTSTDAQICRNIYSANIELYRVLRKFLETNGDKAALKQMGLADMLPETEAYLLEQSGKFKEAKDLYERLYAERPNDLQVLLNVIRINFLLLDYGRVLHYLDEQLPEEFNTFEKFNDYETQTLIDILLIVAKSHLALGKYQEYEDVFEKILTIAKQQYSANSNEYYRVAIAYANSLGQRGNYKAQLEYLQSIYDQIETSTDLLLLIEAERSFSYVCLRIGDLIKAKYHFTRLLNFSGAQFGNKSLELIEPLQGLAEIARQQYNFANRQELLHQAYYLHQNYYHGPHIDSIRILINIANNAYLLGDNSWRLYDLQIALQQLEQLIRFQENTGGHIQYITLKCIALMNLVDAYEKAGERARSLNTFQEAIQQHDIVIRSERYTELPKLAIEIANFYLRAADFESAENMLRNAIEKLGENNPDIIASAELHVLMGEVMLQKNNFEQAIKCSLKGFKLISDVSKFDQERAAICETIIKRFESIEHKQKDTVAARDFCKVLKIRHQSLTNYYGNSHPKVVEALRMLRVQYERLGDKDNAVKVLREAVDIETAERRSKNPLFVRVDIDEFYSHQYYQSSLTNLEQQFSTKAQLYHRNNLVFVDTIFDLMLMYHKLGCDVKVIELGLRILEFHDKANDEVYIDLARLYYMLADAYLIESQYQVSLKFAYLALAELSKIPDETLLVMTLIVAARSHYGLLDRQKALDIIYEASQYQREYLPLNGYLSSSFKEFIADIYFDSAQYSEALTYYEHAVNELISFYGHSKCHTVASIYNKQAQCFQKLDNVLMPDILFSKAMKIIADIYLPEQLAYTYLRNLVKNKFGSMTNRRGSLVSERSRESYPHDSPWSHKFKSEIQVTSTAENTNLVTLQNDNLESEGANIVSISSMNSILSRLFISSTLVTGINAISACTATGWQGSINDINKAIKLWLLNPKQKMMIVPVTFNLVDWNLVIIELYEDVERLPNIKYFETSKGSIISEMIELIKKEDEILCNAIVSRIKVVCDDLIESYLIVPLLVKHIHDAQLVSLNIKLEAKPVDLNKLLVFETRSFDDIVQSCGRKIVSASLSEQLDLRLSTPFTSTAIKAKAHKKGFIDRIVHPKKNLALLIDLIDEDRLSEHIRLALERASRSDIIEYLNLGGNVDYRDNQDQSIVYWLTWLDEPDLLQRVINDGANLQEPNTYGWTPLHVAAYRGHFRCAQILLAEGADLKAKTTADYGYSHLSCPANTSVLDCAILARKQSLIFLIRRFQLILSKSKTPDEQRKQVMALTSVTTYSQWRATTIQQAIEAGDLEFIKSYSDDLSQIVVNNNEPCVVYAARLNDYALCELLLSKRASVDAVDTNGMTAIQHAAKKGLYTIFKLLSDSRADLALRANGLSLMHFAVEGKNVAIIEELIWADIAVEKDSDDNSPFASACLSQSENIVRLLLRYKANINRQNRDGNTALHLCAGEGCLGIISILLGYGVDTSIRNKEGFTALEMANDQSQSLAVGMIAGAIIPNFTSEVDLTNYERYHVGETLLQAIRDGNQAKIDTIINLGLDVSYADEQTGDTALHLAARNGTIELCRQLLAQNARVNKENKHGWAPLVMAVAEQRFDVIDLMLDKGASPLTNTSETYKYRDDFIVDVNSDLLSIARQVGNEDIIKKVQQAIYAYCTQKNNSPDNQLNGAVQSDQFELARVALGVGANVDFIPDGDVFTMIHNSVSIGSIQMVKLLLEHGAKIDVVTSNRQTNLLDTAARHFHVPEMMTLLVEELRFDINRRRPFCGGTPLQVSANLGFLDNVKYLYSQNADPELADNEGMTAILATVNSYIPQRHDIYMQIYCFLKDEAKANLTARNYKGSTLVHMAAYSGAYEILVDLIGRGLLFDEPDIDGNTPLMCACVENHLKIVKYLVELGADITARNKEDVSVFGIAIDSGSFECVRFICEQASQSQTVNLIPIVNSSYRNKKSYPIINASELGYEKIVEFLLAQSDINIDVKTAGKSETALTMAVSNDHTRCAELLVGAGANVNYCSADNEGLTPLQIAIARRNLPLARYFLQHGADPNYAINDTRYNCPPIIQAVNTDDPAFLSILLDHKGIKVHKRGFFYGTALTTAIENGSNVMVRTLLDSKNVKQLFVCNSEGLPPYIIAANHGFRDIAELIKLAVDNALNQLVNLADRETRLHQAVLAGDLEAVTSILQNGGEIFVNVTNYAGLTPLHIAVEIKSSDIVAKLLVVRSLDPNINNQFKQTALFRAAGLGLDKIVELLVNDTRVDVNCLGPMGQTPLTEASENGQAKAVAILVKHKKIKINQGRPYIGNDGINPLLSSCWDILGTGGCGTERNNRPDFPGVLEALLTSKDLYVNVRHVHWGGRSSPLCLAHNQPDNTRLLLTHPDINLNIRTMDLMKKDRIYESDLTPLLEASAINSSIVVGLLSASQGININAVTSDGRSSLHHAVKSNAVLSIRMLLASRDIEINLPDLLGNTPLHAGVEANSKQAVELLLADPRTDLNAVNHKDETALMVAARANNIEVAKLMINAGADIYYRNKFNYTARDYFYMYAGFSVACELCKVYLQEDQQQQMRVVEKMRRQLAEVTKAMSRLEDELTSRDLSIDMQEKLQASLARLSDEQLRVQQSFNKQQQRLAASLYVGNNNTLMIFYRCFVNQWECIQVRYRDSMDGKVDCDTVTFFGFSYKLPLLEQLNSDDKSLYLQKVISDREGFLQEVKVSALLLAFCFEYQIARIFSSNKSIEEFAEGLVLLTMLSFNKAQTNECILFDIIRDAMNHVQTLAKLVKAYRAKKLQTKVNGKQLLTDYIEKPDLVLFDGRCVANIRTSRPNIFGYRLCLAADVPVGCSESVDATKTKHLLVGNPFRFFPNGDVSYDGTGQLRHAFSTVDVFQFKG